MNLELLKEIQYVELSSSETVLINLTNGLADILDSRLVELMKENKFHLIEDEIVRQLLERKYIFETKLDYDEYISCLENKINHLENLELPNFLYIMTYECNLRCSYCYQKGYEIESEGESDLNSIDSFFYFLDEKLRDLSISKEQMRDVKLTLMGGEALMLKNKSKVAHFLNCSRSRGINVNIITNGYDVSSFSDILTQDVVESIQITIDGDEEIHDSRRFTMTGSGSFNRVIESVKLLVNKGVTTYLRINVDEKNIYNLGSLAKQISPYFCDHFVPYIFLMEHEGCMGMENILNDVDALKILHTLSEEEPTLKKIEIAYIGKELINSIFNDDVFLPVLRKCSSSKKQYIFDFNGEIYKCWWGIGNSNFIVGRNSIVDQKKDKQWQSRRTINIKTCSQCTYRFVCGGGCVGREAHKGGISTRKGECRNFKELFDYLVKQEVIINGI